jgi:hypothetical protein
MVYMPSIFAPLRRLPVIVLSKLVREVRPGNRGRICSKKARGFQSLQ